MAVRPFIGTEALAAGTVNRYQLAARYEAIHRNVYMPSGCELTSKDQALAAWLWSGRQATAAGLSAAALHGSKWIDAAFARRARTQQPPRDEGHRAAQ